jgi:hypothetical protein
MISKEQMLSDDDRLLANHWIGYTEFLGSINMLPEGDLDALVQLRMAFFAGVSMTLRILKHKGVSAPIFKNLEKQLEENAEQLKDIEHQLGGSINLGRREL